MGVAAAGAAGAPTGFPSALIFAGMMVMSQAGNGVMRVSGTVTDSLAAVTVTSKPSVTVRKTVGGTDSKYVAKPIHVGSVVVVVLIVDVFRNGGRRSGLEVGIDPVGISQLVNWSVFNDVGLVGAGMMGDGVMIFNCVVGLEVALVVMVLLVNVRSLGGYLSCGCRSRFLACATSSDDRITPLSSRICIMLVLLCD